MQLTDGKDLDYVSNHGRLAGQQLHCRCAFEDTFLCIRFTVKAACCVSASSLSFCLCSLFLPQAVLSLFLPLAVLSTSCLYVQQCTCVSMCYALCAMCSLHTWPPLSVIDFSIKAPTATWFAKPEVNGTGYGVHEHICA